MTLPERLYLERWPEESSRDDAIHYEQTGYGVDEKGRTSEIHVYSRVPVPETDSELLELLERLATASEEFASSEPDMPSYEDTVEEFDVALEDVKAFLQRKKEAAGA